MLCCRDNYVTFHCLQSIFLALAFYNLAYLAGAIGVFVTLRCASSGQHVPLAVLTAGAVARWYPFDTQIIL